MTTFTNSEGRVLTYTTDVFFLNNCIITIELKQQLLHDRRT